MNPKPRVIQSPERVAEALKDGLVLVAPTETCHVFAGNALREKVVTKILDLKNRSGNPIGLLIKNIEMADDLSFLTKKQKELLSAFWPGPVSFVLEKKRIVPDILTAGMNSISMRVSPHPFWKEVFKLIDFPVTATSANLSGENEPYTLREVIERFPMAGQKGVVLTEGSTGREKIKPSTVVSFNGETLRLLRNGPVVFSDIEDKWKALLEE